MPNEIYAWQTAEAGGWEAWGWGGTLKAPTFTLLNILEP